MKKLVRLLAVSITALAFIVATAGLTAALAQTASDIVDKSASNENTNVDKKQKQERGQEQKRATKTRTSTRIRTRM